MVPPPSMGPALLVAENGLLFPGQHVEFRQGREEGWLGDLEVRVDVEGIGVAAGVAGAFPLADSFGNAAVENHVTLCKGY